MAELRFIEDFPKKGVKFIDITPKLADSKDFNNIIELMCANIPDNVDYILAPESRGYIFGAPIAYKLNKGLAVTRKLGKLPNDLVVTAKYEKEYGEDILCLPKNTNYKNKNFYFVDDILATAGTIKACKELIEKVDGVYVGGIVYINISDLNNENIDYIEKM